MRRQFVFGTVLSILFAAGLAAQQTQGGQSGQTPSPTTRGSEQGDSRSGQTGQSVTLTGCLQAAGQMAGGSTSTSGVGTSGPGSTGGTSAGAGAQGAQRGYVLTNVSAGTTGGSGAGTSTSAGTAGSTTAGATAGRMGATSYRLMGGADQDLQKYVGQRVQVTGTVVGRGGAGEGAGTPGSTGSSAGSATGSTAGSSTSSTSGTQTGTSTGQEPRTGSSTGASSGSMASRQGQGGMMPSLRVTSVMPATGGGDCK